MEQKTFAELIKKHRQKLCDAFIKLSDQNWKEIGDNLEIFFERAGKVYGIPKKILNRELDAVKKNIDAGNATDYVPYLDPIE
ncbi:MAG: hypothetical protein Q7S68_03480 [Deltaproteobacteria bacterium]|nr:hypothetical protein [Deltaproteobacteria bacterium]